MTEQTSGKTNHQSPARANGLGTDRPTRDFGISRPTPNAPPRKAGFITRNATVLGALGVIAVGTVVRIVLAMRPDFGHLPDTDLFVGWTRSMFEHGLAGFYRAGSFCDYPPLAMLTVWAIGQAAAVVDASLANEHLLQSLLKAPACLADLAIAIILLVEGRRLVGGKRAVAASALYFLNPVTIYNSAFWGQVDAVHSGCVLLSVVLVARGRWGWAGGIIALALLQKFQSIAFVPLVLFQAYHYRRWRGVTHALVGATFVSAWVVLPFALTGTLDDVLQRAYVNVVGQYSDLSASAYNVWYLSGTPEMSDTVVPRIVALAAANGNVSVAAADSPLLWLTWRHISLVGYSLAVAIILCILSARPGGTDRMALAGMLGLAFFLFPTEMHERYAHPAIALLALWAVTHPWKERVFCLLSVLLLLNLTSILPVDHAAIYIAASIIAVFVAILAWTLIPKQCPNTTQETHVNENVTLEEPPPPSQLITWFRRGTFAAVVTLIAATATIGYGAAQTRSAIETSQCTYLSELRPIRAHQSWGDLHNDANVIGGPIIVDDVLYMRGLGTHAKSELTFRIPNGVGRFEAIVGVDKSAAGKGTAVAIVLLDGQAVFETPVLSGTGPAIPVSVALGEANTITLRAFPTDDGTTADHVSWALARFTE